MKMKDRIQRADPVLHALYDRLNDLINGHNELVKIVLGGQNPHKANDATNVLTIGKAGEGIDSIIDLAQNLITKYEAHIASTAAHVGADSTNVVTELGVPTEVYTLLNELKTDYNAHRVLTTSSVHAGADSTNIVAAANATTKATAFALVNDIKTQFIANFANITTHHGAADTVGVAAATAVATLTATSTWTEIAAAADALRAAYEAHRVLTAGTVHGAADSTNTITATAVGTVTTALYAGLNELKGDFNTHIAESGTYHVHRDDSMLETSTNASTLATAKALVNSLMDNYTDHISRAEENVVGPLVASLDEK